MYDLNLSFSDHGFTEVFLRHLIRDGDVSTKPLTVVSGSFFACFSLDAQDYPGNCQWVLGGAVVFVT